MSGQLGKIVTYHLPRGDRPIAGKRSFPAIVTTEHDDGTVNLTVFADGGSTHHTSHTAHSKDAHENGGRWTELGESNNVDPTYRTPRQLRDDA